MQVEHNVLCYIQSEQIDITLLAQQTHINIERLDGTKRQEWTAEEFLRICDWLGVDPWQFYIEYVE